MTHEFDFIRVNMMLFGPVVLPLNEVGLSWPPPEFLIIDEGGIREATENDPRQFVLHRTRMSALTDEQISDTTHIARGAEYEYVEP